MQKINLIYGLEGKETNNFKKLPINNIKIPICKEPLIIHKKPLFLIDKKKNNPKRTPNTK